MRDKLPREYISYNRMKYKEKYLVSMPFYYTSETTDVEPAERHSANIRLDADDEHERNMLKENLLGSLPSGYVYGQNISNLFSSLTVGYQDPMDFMDLPIPLYSIFMVAYAIALIVNFKSVKEQSKKIK